jgi:hypothetical protein
MVHYFLVESLVIWPALYLVSKLDSGPGCVAVRGRNGLSWQRSIEVGYCSGGFLIHTILKLNLFPIASWRGGELTNDSPTITSGHTLHAR